MSMMGIPAAISGLCKWVKYILQNCNVGAIFFSHGFFIFETSKSVMSAHCRVVSEYDFASSILLLNSKFSSPLPLV